jgi:hypothetical protein
MTKGIIASTAFALLCAGSMQASAALSHEHSDRVAHHRDSANQSFTSMRAAIAERPTIFPSARPQPYSYNYHETDGLSRNPNDCAVWGCIDSN